MLATETKVVRLPIDYVQTTVSNETVYVVVRHYWRGSEVVYAGTNKRQAHQLLNREGQRSLQVWINGGLWETLDKVVS